MTRKTITAKELAKLTKKTKRRKYRNTPRDYDDVRYASIAEATRAEELDRMKTAGEIWWWIGQPTVRLGCGLNVYRPDFLVVPNPKRSVVAMAADVNEMHVLRPWFEDVKGGVWSEKFRHNVRLWMRYGDAELRIVKEGETIAWIFPDSWPEASVFPDGKVVT